MALEIEAKMQIEDLEAIARRLSERGGEPLGAFLEVNTFFDTEDRSLLAADRGLRLRVATDLQTRAVKAVLTHKGPNQHGALKSREETELVVEDARQAVDFLRKLGFARTMSFEKRRHSWRFADCAVELDEVPILGSFIEIEGPSERAVLHARDALGLADRPLIKSSYIAMLASHLQERGQREVDVRFTSQC